MTDLAANVLALMKSHQEQGHTLDVAINDVYKQYVNTGDDDSLDAADEAIERARRELNYSL